MTPLDGEGTWLRGALALGRGRLLWGVATDDCGRLEVADTAGHRAWTNPLWHRP
jgi:hypothetical protein